MRGLIVLFALVGLVGCDSTLSSPIMGACREMCAPQPVREVTAVRCECLHWPYRPGGVGDGGAP